MRTFVFDITIGLGGYIHGQIVIAAVSVVRGRNLDVVQRDDSRQCGYTADERAEFMIAADQLDPDRKLGIEAVALLRTRLEQLFLKAGGKTSLRNIDQKI